MIASGRQVGAAIGYFRRSPAALVRAPSAATERAGFIDALRSASVVSIICLHIVLSHPAQLATGPNSGYAKLAAILCSIFSNETLVFISLFLTLRRLQQRALLPLLRSRSARIGLPFLAFSLIYVLVDAAGPRQGVIFTFPPGQAGALLLVAGLGQYNLHFLPALLLLTVISPIFMWRLSLPAVALALLTGSAVRFCVEAAVFAGAGAPLTAGQLLALHAGKIASYFPYGFLAQWFLERAPDCPRREQPRRLPLVLLLALTALTAIQFALMSIASSAGGGRLGAGVLLEELTATLLIATGIFLASAWSSTGGEGGALAAAFGRFYPRAFVVLMIHPLFLAMFKALAAVRQATPAFDLLCLLFVFSASWAAAGALQEIARRLRPAARIA